MANAANLINFGSGGGGALAVGDWTYSAYPLSAPAYLPLNNDTASYLTSSYPALGAIYAPTTVAYSASSVAVPPLRNPNNSNIQWNGIFGNKTFFLWNTSGNIMVSTDLVSWTSRGIPTASQSAANNNSTITARYAPGAPSNNWIAIRYGNGKLVAIRNVTAVGAWTENTSAMSSDNGATWTFGSLPAVSIGGGVVNVSWSGLTFGDGTFTAYGWVDDGVGSQYGVAAQCNDGVNWITRTGQLWSFSGVISGVIAYGNGTFVFGTSATVNHYSPDNFVTNTSTTISGTARTTSLAYGGGLFVATVAGASTSIYTSPTGATWTARTVPSQTWSSVTYSNGYFVAVGGTGAASTVIATSPDGVTWTSQTVPSATLRGTVAGGLGKFFYQNDSGATLTQVNLSASATTFSLPMVMNPPTGSQAYIKAT